MNSLILIFLFPFKLLKKTRIDNFIGGLIFGAIFSLFVNVATVKVQEDINRQRVLEALERELVQQSIDANNAIIDENTALNSQEDDFLGIQAIGRRYPTRIWDNLEASKYIFELPSSTAGKIESHYSVITSVANSNAEDIAREFNTLYQGCTYTVDRIINKQPLRPKKECREIVLASFYVNNIYNDQIKKYVDDIRKEFHPTQDRIDSWWLSLLLGKNLHPVMSWSEEKPTVFLPTASPN